MNSSTMSAASDTDSTGQVLYLLGFSSGSESNTCSLSGAVARLDFATAAMLRQLGIESVQVAGVVAWYKLIDRCDFEGEQGDKNLADIQWLTPKVIAHERVVSELSHRMAFYPSRFGTLFSTKASLASLSLGVQSLLRDFFDRVGDRLEWGLKFYGDPIRAAEILAQKEGLLENGKPTGGANYLKLRQMQRERNAATANLLSHSFANAVHFLQTQYKDLVSRPLVASNVDSKREELVGNLAILIRETESPSLVRWAHEWNENQMAVSGLRIEITGPWPAYSFCPSLSPTKGSEAA